MRPVITGHAARQGQDMTVAALKQWLGEVTGQPHPTLEIEFVNTVEEFWDSVIPQPSPPAPRPATTRRRRGTLGSLVILCAVKVVPVTLLIPGLLLQ